MTDATEVTGLLADADVRGQVDRIIAVCRGAVWHELWAEVGVPLCQFDDVGLPADAPDAQVWETSQRHGLVLLTGNRNAESENSLEATIRTRGTPDSLPVLTLADRDRILADSDYAELVATRLMERLSDIDNLRGSGRIWLP